MTLYDYLHQHPYMSLFIFLCSLSVIENVASEGLKRNREKD